MLSSLPASSLIKNSYFPLLGFVSGPTSLILQQPISIVTQSFLNANLSTHIKTTIYIIIAFGMFHFGLISARGLCVCVSVV